MALWITSGHTGELSIALPVALEHVSEAVHDALIKAYPAATVRTVVNHCLTPEIMRLAKIDPKAAVSVIEQLRAANPAPVEPSTLHEAIAASLGWTVEEASAFSLRALREFVKVLDPKLAATIARDWITVDPKHLGYCCFCSGAVSPVDYVEYAHVPGSERASHRMCLDASRERSPKLGDSIALQGDDALYQCALALFVGQPDVAFSWLTHAFLARFGTDTLRVVAIAVLAAQ